MLLTSIRIAIRALGRHKLRTALTMLGMIIGVAAVMTMVALGNGAQESVEQDVRSAGTNLIHVNAGNFTRGGEESKIATGLGSAIDADAGRRRRDWRRCRGVKLRVQRREAARLDRVTARRAITDRCSAPTRRIRRCTAGDSTSGEFFQAADVARPAPVAVLGRAPAIRCSAPAPTRWGATSTIRDMTVHASSASPTRPIRDQMDMVFVPYTPLQDVLGIEYLHSVIVEAAQAGDASRIAAEITPLLRSRHASHIDAAIARLRQGGRDREPDAERRAAACPTTSR